MAYRIDLPITHVSPTEVGKTKFDLSDQNISFYLIQILQVLILSIYVDNVLQIKPFGKK